MEPLKAHEQLFGLKSPPTERQKAFYANEVARGFSTKEQDSELIDAVVIRALAQVRESGSQEYHKVLFMFPEDQRAWVIERIHNVAKTTIIRIGEVRKSESGQVILAHVRRWIEALQLGPLEAWKGSGPPPRWVAFGYAKEDSVPTWLKDALV